MNTLRQNRTFLKVLLLLFTALAFCAGVFYLTLLPEEPGVQAKSLLKPAACSQIGDPAEITSPPKPMYAASLRRMWHITTPALIRIAMCHFI